MALGAKETNNGNAEFPLARTQDQRLYHGRSSQGVCHTCDVPLKHGYCLVFYSNFTEHLQYLYDSARRPCYIPSSGWSGRSRWGVGSDRPLLRRYGQEGRATPIMLVRDWLLHNMLNINVVYVQHLGQSIPCIALPYRARPSHACASVCGKGGTHPNHDSHRRRALRITANEVERGGGSMS